MLDSYFPVLMIVLAAMLVAGIITALAIFVGPRNPSKAKLEPYEGGVPQVQATSRRFPVKFLEVAMIFLIFDIETVAFFPWAVMLNQLGAFALLEMGLFLLVLVVGYIYLWRKGAFNWEKEL